MNRFERYVENSTFVRRLHHGVGRTLSAMVLICGLAGAGKPPIAAAPVSNTPPSDGGFSVLYAFQAPAPVSFTSALGSQPDTTPALGPGNTIYGMAYDGGANGTGVVYRPDMESNRYVVLHTLGALDASGDNEDGAYPGNALTRGPANVFYGMAQGGGANGTRHYFRHHRIRPVHSTAHVQRT